jgi:hypothetical protein
MSEGLVHDVQVVEVPAQVAHGEVQLVTGDKIVAGVSIFLEATELPAGLKILTLKLLVVPAVEGF